MAKLLILLCFPLLYHVLANVEKTIFVAPATESLPQDASIDNLLLTRLSEQHPSVRTSVSASFPTADRPKGTETWMLLEGLRPQTRYEVRICWLATQPTSFWIYSHPVGKVFESPDLVTSLSAYSYARHEELSTDDNRLLQLRKADFIATESTLLFLQIFAAADYFSLNETLMEIVPPVAVDVILDPYVFNVFPLSLLRTGLYLLLIAAGAWFLSGWISRLLAGRGTGQPGRDLKKIN